MLSYARASVVAVELPEAPPGMKVGERVRFWRPIQGRFGLFAGMKPHERVEYFLRCLVVSNV